VSVSSLITTSSCSIPFRPIGATTPNSDKWARKAFDICVRWRLSINRTRCNIITLCCSGVFTGTKRIVGRVTASQMASASAASFFCRFK